MSRKMDAMHREMYKFLDQENPRNKQEFNQKIAEFQEKWNASIKNGGDGHFLEKNPVDEAYDLLERAENAENITEARKLAKQAYLKSSECFDAVIFLAQNAPNLTEANKIIDQGLLDEEQRLKSEKLWTKENLGHFYTMFESRPYIRGLMAKGSFQIAQGKFRQAAHIFERIIELNNSDNLGARYFLMAIYALLEDQKKAEKLYSHYPYEEFLITFSLFVLYYKLDLQKEADKYFKLSIEANRHILGYFKNDTKILKAMFSRYDSYQRGSLEEITVYMQDFDFLMWGVKLGIVEYIRNYQKRQSKK